MKLTFWLIVNRNGRVRTLKGKPHLGWDDIAIYVTMDVPIDLFKRPTLSAQITIPEDKVPATHIDAETVNNLEEILKAEGFHVKIHIQTEEEDDDGTG